MRNALALHWVLLVALLGSCSSQLITSRVLTTQPDDNAEEARTQEEIVLASNAWANSVSPEAAVNQRRAPGTSPRLLPDVVLAGHTGQVWHAAFSPDGSRIVTTSDDGTARLWDIEGKPLAVLVGHNARASDGRKGVWSAQFSPDGSRIVTAHGDTARVYRVPATTDNTSTGAAANR